MGSAEAIVAVLRENPTFRVARDEHLRRMVGHASLLEIAAGQPIFREGDPGATVYVLVRGIVRVFHAHESGRQLTVKHLEPPTTFGEMEVLTSRDYLECAEALVATTLVAVPADAFRAFVAADAEATRMLLLDVCSRFCVAARHEHAAFFEVPVRLASLLLSYSELFGRPAARGIQIHIPLTQDDFADALGVAVRSVARALKSFKQEGWIEQQRGWWIIRDLEALQRYSGGLRFNLNYKFTHGG